MTEQFLDERQNQTTTEWKRGRAKLGRTVAALLGRGFDSATARHLQGMGYSLAALQRSTEIELQELGLDQTQIKLLRGGARPSIPPSNIALLLWQNR